MKKYEFIKNYIKYYFSAKTKYSIHSPFVFEFVTQVLEVKTSQVEKLKEIEILRKSLLSSNAKIQVVDLGANSIQNSSSVKKVREIVKNSAKSRKYVRLLYRIAEHYKLQNILELGTSAGISSMYIASSANEVTTIEGSPEIANLATENFSKLNFNNIQLIKGNFDDVLPEILNKNKKFDCVFFDGNHREDATLKYFEQCLPYVTNETVFIFDDINWSEGMKKAWHNIMQHPSVKVTIDLYFLGIVFFRKELSKENFVIRF
jgi:predicted O-methyltransferase YrrM